MSTARSLSPRPASPLRDAVTCHVAGSPEELDEHFAIRQTVFVDEQAIFDGHDRDEHDDGPATLHAVGLAGLRTGGAVRLYPLPAGGLWKGDRLAVLPAFRHGLLGAALVRFAVSTAGSLGGERMVAMIQLPNVSFFETLGWRLGGAVVLHHGLPHQPMEIPLRESGALNRRAR